MHWFSHRRSPSPPGGTQWYRLVLRATYCVRLATAHAQLCIVNGMTQQLFVFCPWWPWPLTLTFELGRVFCTTYLTAKFDRPTFSRSEVIVRTNKQTHWQTNRRRWKIHRAALCYDGGYKYRNTSHMPAVSSDSLTDDLSGSSTCGMDCRDYVQLGIHEHSSL